MGSLVGAQTVPRSEAMALKMALLAIYAQFCDGNVYQVHTDNKAVYQTWHKGRHAQINSSWSDIWDEIFKINVPRSAINLRKVKAHCDEAMVQAGAIPLPVYCGNSWADHYAGEAAKHAQLPDTEVNIVGYIDAMTWLVQTRLLAIARSFTKQPKDLFSMVTAEAGITRTSKMFKLQEAGHSIIKQGRRYHCCECLQEWTVHTQDKVLALGACIGTPQIRMDWDTPARPLMAERSRTLSFAGGIIHRSHHIAWYRGVTICLRCGYYATNKVVRQLGKPCTLNQVAYYGKRNLANFKAPDPKPPGSLREWPAPHEASPDMGAAVPVRGRESSSILKPVCVKTQPRRGAAYRS